MESRTTQGTSRASMIMVATVVFPEALPPPRPARKKGWGHGALTCLQGQLHSTHHRMPCTGRDLKDNAAPTRLDRMIISNHHDSVTPQF